MDEPAGPAPLPTPLTLPAIHASHSGTWMRRDDETRRVAKGEAVADGLLFVVHEVAWMPDGTRRYPHRFVLLDRGGQRFRRTRPFFFLDRGIEFAAGLVEVDGTLLVSFGVADESAWIARIPTADVIARLGGLE